MQYHSLQHWTLLPSPVTSTTGCVLLWLHLFILSGFISPLFSSSILGTYRPGEFIFQCPFHTVLLPFSHCSWGSQGKNTEVVFQKWHRFDMPINMTKDWTNRGSYTAGCVTLLQKFCKKIGQMSRERRNFICCSCSPRTLNSQNDLQQEQFILLSSWKL